MNTLLLDTNLWDLCLDASGDVAMATNPYAIAQDVASAIRLFLGELWYDTSKGMPYWQNVLGQYPPASYIKAELVAAALTVPEVVEAQVIDMQLTNRQLTGTVQVIDVTGQTNNVRF